VIIWTRSITTVDAGGEGLRTAAGQADAILAGD
jgi:hypothetical protein